MQTLVFIEYGLFMCTVGCFLATMMRAAVQENTNMLMLSFALLAEVAVSTLRYKAVAFPGRYRSLLILCGMMLFGSLITQLFLGGFATDTVVDSATPFDHMLQRIVFFKAVTLLVGFGFYSLILCRLYCWTDKSLGLCYGSTLSSHQALMRMLVYNNYQMRD